MKQIDIFRLVIRIFGFYIFMNFLFNSLSSLAYIILYFQTDSMWVNDYVFSLIPIIVNSILFYLFVLRTDVVLNWLRLHKKFGDEKIDLSGLNKDNFLKVAVIIIGVLILLDGIPMFISSCYYVLKTEVQVSGLDHLLEEFGSFEDYKNWILSFVKIGLGYYLLTNFNKVGAWFQKRNKLTNEETIDSVEDI